MGVLGGVEAFPRRGVWGLGAVAAGVAVSFVEAGWAPSVASILAWWGLAIALDAAAFWRRGESVSHDAPDAFVWMAVLSIFLGVGMEWTAGRLVAWSYLGLPYDEFLRYGVQGATLAAFVPALHGAAALLGAGSVSAPRPEAIPKVAAALGIVLGLGCLAVPLAAPELLPGFAGMLFVGFGLWSLSDSINALRDRPNILEQRRRRLVAWALAAGALVAGETLLTSLTGQGRYPVGYETRGLAALVMLGPALRASYLFLADTLGLPAWPPREESSALLR